MRKIILIASLAILTLMAAVTGADASSTAVSSFSPSSYVVGSGVRVSIAVTPDANIASYTVEDTVPSGWTVSNISDGGTWRARDGKVQWNFADNAARTLAYTATPPAGESGTRTFSGVACFQMEHTFTHEQPITGARGIDKAPDVVISGCVRTSGDMALPGVTITPGSGTPVTTDADGNYRLTIDYGWSGTVVPSKAGYIFSPRTVSYTTITSDQEQDYTAIAIPTVTISGSVKTYSGAALAGVILTATNSSNTVTTDDDGNYQLPVPYGWSGIITPYKAGYAFSPQSKSYASVTSNQTQDYTTANVTAAYTISGCVKTSGREALAGVNIITNDGIGATTDAGGNYQLTVPAKWYGTVTPSKAGYAFSPCDRYYFAVSSNYTLENYIAETAETVTISGYVMSNGVAVPGVVISPSSGIATMTDANGFYILAVPNGWSGTVTPLRDGCTFSPTSSEYTGITSSQTQSYAAAMPPVTISGIVKTDSGAALAGATISATNGGGTVTTDAGGNYRLTMPYGWSGTVRPSKAGYLFSPQFKSYTSVTSDQEQDYTALAIPTVTISGTVKTDSGAALAGAAISATNGGGTVTTDAGGNYQLPVPYGWSGIVIPCKAECAFSPQSKSYTSVTSNQAQDYTALEIGIVTISGAIKTSGGTGIAGVDIIAASKRCSTGATTDADGNYHLTITAGVGNVDVTPSKTGYTFSPDYVTYDIGGPTHHYENYTAIPAETVIITGCVITSNGVVIPNVTIAPSNGPVIMTDAYGCYMLVVPKNRSVTVTPLKQGFTFVPSESTYIDIAESKSQNYIADGPPVTISGYIKTADGTAISGVTVTPTGGSAVTAGSDGYYQLSLPSGWSGTVTPGKSGYIFSPASQSYQNVSADQTQDYTGTLGQVKISGSIKLSDGTAISGVTLTATNGGGTTTDANGYYQLTVDSGWSGAVTPAKTGYKFNPASQSFANVISDQILNYTGIKVYAISGYVRDSADSGISGITLTATNDGGAAATDANGYYQLAVPDGWSGTVAPSSGSYRFFVLSDVTGGSTRSYINITSNQTGQNYLGQAPWRGLAMVSIPIIPGSDNPRDVIGFTGECLVTYDIAISDYKYVWNDMTIFDPSATEALLTGFWAKFQSDTLVQVPAGDIPAQDQPVTIPLAGGGWNLIGQPFMRAVKWDTYAIKVKKADDTIISLCDPAARDIVLDYLWGWRSNPSSAARGEYYLVWTASTPPGITNKMVPWQSYWIYAYKDCSLILPPPEPLIDP